MVDISGVSGIGVVAQGVEFDDGVAVMRWMTDRRSTVIFKSLEELKEIHGHGGCTTIEFVDSK
jgi:hypothetical protein